MIRPCLHAIATNDKLISVPCLLSIFNASRRMRGRSSTALDRCMANKFSFSDASFQELATLATKLIGRVSKIRSHTLLQSIISGKGL